MGEITLRNRLIKNYLFCLFLALSYSSMAQVSISGPQCIIPGIKYQYLLTTINDSSSLKVCITGGRLSSGSTCTPDGKSPDFVIVTWADTTTRQIDVTSSMGSATLLVSGTTELQGGQIDDSDKVQVYKDDNTNYTFHCNEASGGHCSPLYSYQWQKSENGLNWTDLDNTNEKDFRFSGNIIVNTFFRRVTTESRSNSIAYSSSATLTVNF